MVNRGIRWNMVTNTGEQIRFRHKYTFVIINKPREIERIRERIYSQLSKIDTLDELTDYAIPNSDGLHCNAFSLLSEIGKIEDPISIYANLREFRKDRDLVAETGKEIIPYLERLTA